MSFDTDDTDRFDTVRSILVPSADVLLGTTVAALALVVGLTTAGVARAVFGLVLVMFLPGYAVVTALFPGAPGDQWVVRRLALPFGVSLALLPVLGLTFSGLGVPFSPVTVLGTTAAITVLGLLVAGRRRRHLTEAQRGNFVLRQWAGRADRTLLDRPTTELLVNALTLVAVVTAMAGLVFAVTVPAPDPQYARFSVLTENESGELVADGYPTEFTAGEGRNVVLEIANQGPDRRSYTVVVQLQRFDESTDRVTARSRVLTLTQSVSAGETWNRPVTVTPDMTGREMRLTFLLYPGDAPGNPTVESADEHLFLWVNVTDGTTGGPVTPTPSTPVPVGTPSPTPTAANTTNSTPGVFAPETATTATPANETVTPTAGTSTPTSGGGG